MLTTAVAALLLAFGPAPGDAAAHLYRTFLVRHGALVWDNLWFAGHYPLASYSLLYYLPAAVFGNLPLVFAAAVASTVLFAVVAFREWGSVALWPSRVFGILAAAPVFTGLYSYALGFAALLGALRAVQTKRTWLAILLAALTLGFSPLAFAFLVLILFAVLVARRGLAPRTLILGAALVALAGFELVVLKLFPSPGVYPFDPVDLAAVLGVSVLGALLARRAANGTPIVAFFVLWAIGSVLAYVVPTPVGDNWTRLRAFVFPLMLLTALLAGFRPRLLATVALAGAFAYNLTPYLMLIPYRTDGRPATAAFWQPTVDFLGQSGPDYRVEVVPTAAHWEAYWLPRAGYAIARGWYRQLDIADNSSLYGKRLTPGSYGRWLRALGVKYVLLPATRLDPVGGPAEARLLRSGAAGLSVAFRGANGTIYELPDPTPLLTGPAPAEISRLDYSTITGQVAAPGRYLLRERYTPYLRLHGAGCMRPAPGGMTWLELSSAGAFRLEVPRSPETLLRIVAGEGDQGAGPRLARNDTAGSSGSFGPLAVAVARAPRSRQRRRGRRTARLPRAEVERGRARTHRRQLVVGGRRGRPEPRFGDRPGTGLEDGRRASDPEAPPAPSRSLLCLLRRNLRQRRPTRAGRRGRARGRPRQTAPTPERALARPARKRRRAPAAGDRPLLRADRLGATRSDDSALGIRRAPLGSRRREPPLRSRRGRGARTGAREPARDARPGPRRGDDGAHRAGHPARRGKRLYR